MPRMLVEVGRPTRGSRHAERTPPAPCGALLPWGGGLHFDAVDLRPGGQPAAALGDEPRIGGLLRVDRQGDPQTNVPYRVRCFH